MANTENTPEPRIEPPSESGAEPASIAGDASQRLAELETKHAEMADAYLRA